MKRNRIAGRALNWLAERGIIGTPGVPVNQSSVEYAYVRPNRQQRRYAEAMQLKQAAEPNRRKYEKRGVPGRAGKGRAPLRRS